MSEASTKMHALSNILIIFVVVTNFTANSDGYVLSKSWPDDEPKPTRRSHELDSKIYIAIEDNNQEGPTVTQQQKKWAELAKKVYKYVTDNTKGNPMFRASNNKPMFSEPEFKMMNNERTSLVVELNPDSILNVLSDVISSDNFQGKMNSYAKKAAVVYRSLRNGLFDEDNPQMGAVDLS